MTNNLLRQEITLHFCYVKIYDDYIYVVINEGINVCSTHNEYLVSIANQYFKNRDFVYITDRKNSYSVDPTVYFQTAAITNLKAVIIIQSETSVVNNPVIESLFFDKPIHVVHSLEQALQYKEATLEE